MNEIWDAMPRLPDFLGWEVFVLGWRGSAKVWSTKATMMMVSTCPLLVNRMVTLSPPWVVSSTVFLGMTGCYRSFCKNFSVVVAPLTPLCSPKVSFVWTVKCQHASEAAKSFLCSAPVLATPNFSIPFKLEVDASDSRGGLLFGLFGCSLLHRVFSHVFQVLLLTSGSTRALIMWSQCLYILDRMSQGKNILDNIFLWKRQLSLSCPQRQ